jgi:hypothetical protein
MAKLKEKHVYLANRCHRMKTRGKLKQECVFELVATGGNGFCGAAGEQLPVARIYTFNFWSLECQTFKTETISIQLRHLGSLYVYCTCCYLKYLLCIFVSCVYC